MLEALSGELTAIADGEPSGSVYERCGRLDSGLAIAVRLFEWYASKYDQRLDATRGKALAAADEIVRSCWSEPFSLLGRKPPTGPLAYLEPDFDAYATPRVSVPRDLQGQRTRWSPTSRGSSPSRSSPSPARRPRIRGGWCSPRMRPGTTCSTTCSLTWRRPPASG